MVHSRGQVFLSYAPITLLDKLYFKLGFITVMSIGTIGLGCETIWEIKIYQIIDYN